MQTTGSVFGNGAGDDMQSVMSETPSVFSGKITHAERNLSKLEGNRAKELELAKRQLDDTLNELSSVK